MKEILVEGIFIEPSGLVDISFDLLKDLFIESEDKVPIALNASRNKIRTSVKAGKETMEQYRILIKTTERRFLYYSIVSDSKARKCFRFDFSKTKSLGRFIGHSFDLIHVDEKKGKDHYNYIQFDFEKDMGEYFPRRIEAIIKQGALLIGNKAPPKFIKTLENLKYDCNNKPIPYASMKLFSLLKQKNLYDILVTFNEKSINKISTELGGGISYYTQNIYLKKKEFGEFIKSNKTTFIRFFHIGDIDKDFSEEISLTKPDVIQLLKKFECPLSRKELIQFNHKAVQDLLQIVQKYSFDGSDKLDWNDIDAKAIMVKSNLIKCVLKKKALSIPLDENIYDQYLLDKEIFGSKSDLKEIKKKSQKMKGIAEYFFGIFGFLEEISKVELDLITDNLIKKYYERIKEIIKDKELDDYDFGDFANKTYYFEEPEKRAKYYVKTTIIFLDNNDLILTLDPTLEIDYSLNLVEQEIQISFDRGFFEFNKKHKKEIESKELIGLTYKEIKILQDLLTNLRLKSQKDIHYKFIKNAIFYSAIIKTFFGSFKTRFKIKDQKTILNLPLLLGVFNSFVKYYPESTKESYINDYFEINCGELTELARKDIMETNRFSKVLILLYLSKKSLDKIVVRSSFAFYPKSRLKEVLDSIFAFLVPEFQNDNFRKDIETKLLVKYTSENEINDAISLLKKSISGKIRKENVKDFDLLVSKFKDAIEKNINGYFELETICDLCGSLIKVIYSSTFARHDILAAGSFGLFMLALDLTEKVSLSSISKVVKIDPTSLHRQAIKSVSIGNEETISIKSLSVSDEAFKEKTRAFLVKFLLMIYIEHIIDIYNSTQKLPKESVKELYKRLDFFKGHEIFSKALISIKPLLEKLREYIPPSETELFNQYL